MKHLVIMLATISAAQAAVPMSDDLAFLLSSKEIKHIAQERNYVLEGIAKDIKESEEVPGSLTYDLFWKDASGKKVIGKVNLGSECVMGTGKCKTVLQLWNY